MESLCHDVMDPNFFQMSNKVFCMQQNLFNNGHVLLKTFSLDVEMTCNVMKMYSI